MAGQGRDIKLSLDRVEGYRGFCNKLWNAVKFFHLQLEPAQGGEIEEPRGGLEKWLTKEWVDLSAPNQWIIVRLQKLIPLVQQSLEKFEINVGAQALYDFTWHELCDWYIEFSKLSLREGGAGRVQTLYTLRYVLGELLRLMHPFMPFVTEELWQSLPWNASATTTARKELHEPEIYTLMLQPFPKVCTEFKDCEAEKTISAIREIIESLRNFRGENNISPKVEFDVRYAPGSPAADVFVKMHSQLISSLARIKQFVRISNQGETGPESVITVANPPIEFRISLKGLVNVDEESKRLKKEIEKLDDDLNHVRKKLSQETFLARAPQELVEKEKKREQELLSKKTELDAALNRLSQLG
jgi:valyl-tRNA synthetase